MPRAVSSTAIISKAQLTLAKSPCRISPNQRGNLDVVGDEGSVIVFIANLRQQLLKIQLKAKQKTKADIAPVSTV
jgi:hypothetical protein